MKWLLPTVFLVFSLGCGSKPEADKTQKKDSAVTIPVETDSLRKGLLFPKQMTVVRKSAYDDFYIRIKDSSYFCSYKGKLQSADTLGNRVSYLFDLKAEYLIDVIYLMPIGSDQFFVSWQETDHKGVFSYYAVYERGREEPVWKSSIKAHSPGQPIIDSGDVYISSLGMIGKVGLYTGEVRWKFDSLFDPFTLKYKQFDKPLLYTNTACFFDFPIKGKKSKRDSIWVNEVTGKIIR